MLRQEDDVEIYALAARGWSVSAIARHTGRDRTTIRRYLAGEGALARRAPAASCLERFRGYIAARFAEDPHLPASASPTSSSARPRTPDNCGALSSTTAASSSPSSCTP